MNKAEISQRLNELPFSPDQYWLLFDTAKVFLGLQDAAGGIHLGCTDEMADALEAQGYLKERFAQNKALRRFIIQPDIFVYEYYLYAGIDEIDGFQVIVPEGVRMMDEKHWRSMGFDPEKLRTYRTEHFIFYYVEGSLAEKDILEISERQEKCYREICNALKVELDYPAHYYLFNSAYDLNRYNGSEGLYGFFSPPDVICATYCDHIDMTDYHETVHLISRLLGRPESKAVQEGLAVSFDHEWSDVECIGWAVWFLRRDGFLKVAELLDNEEFKKQPGNYIYPLMGAFTEWLINTFGMEKYREFYQYTDSVEGMRDVYGKSPGELNELFVEYVKGYHLTDDKVEQMKEVLWKLGQKWY